MSQGVNGTHNYHRMEPLPSDDSPTLAVCKVASLILIPVGGYGVAEVTGLLIGLGIDAVAICCTYFMNQRKDAEQERRASEAPPIQL